MCLCEHMCEFHPVTEIIQSLLLVALQMEHSILEKEYVPNFIQRISEVIDLVRDNQQATLAASAAAAAAAGQPVQLSSDAKSESVGDEISCGSVGTSSPPRSSPSNLQKEAKPGGSSEVQ